MRHGRATATETELKSFRAGITKTGGLGLTALVLNDAIDPSVRDAYRRRVVAPRRTRIAAILDSAAAAGQIEARPADRRILVSMYTGSWYGLAIAGDPPPKNWAKRTATLVWRAAGGVEPE